DYDIRAYIAPPGCFCRGVITKIGFGFSTEYLSHREHQTDGTRRPLNARMMGKFDAAFITFQGIRIPRFVRCGMDECQCKPYFPKEQLCDICLGLGHKRDNHCSTCGLLNGDMKEHECSPYCIYTTRYAIHEVWPPLWRLAFVLGLNKLCPYLTSPNDPHCPARMREPYNKSRLQDQQRAEQQQEPGQSKGTKEQPSQNSTTARQPLLQ
ncbi:hypothetical protein HPB47_001789, partial [Ixodes persulcatus]